MGWDALSATRQSLRSATATGTSRWVHRRITHLLHLGRVLSEMCMTFCCVFDLVRINIRTSSLPSTSQRSSAVDVTARASTSRRITINLYVGRTSTEIGRRDLRPVGRRELRGW